jgi:hypothetical protein
LLWRNRILLFLLLLVIPLSPQSSASVQAQTRLQNAATTQVNGTSKVLALWNRITVDDVNVQSRRGPQVIQDCSRLGTNQTGVECFSIQQNFWISNSTGDFVFWAQNAVEFAELEAGVFFATYAFVVWNSADPLQPSFCDPSSLSESFCRAPIFTDRVRLPQPFTFYAGISNAAANYTLQVSNNIASRDWDIPASAGCPCFIETLRQKPVPWGYSPFELVAVGLDDFATAFFGKGTSGIVGPGFVEYVDGRWHQVVLSTLHCLIPSDCSKVLSTGEDSRDLGWDSETGRIYWSDGNYDQGVYISAISQQPTEQPPIPKPAVETYLYFRMDLWDMALPTIIDDQGRATGYNASSGGFVERIPLSFLARSDEMGVIILNPHGSYRVVLTPVASGPYHLLVSREFNVNRTTFSKVLDGSISAWQTKQFMLNSDTMSLTIGASDWGTLLVMVEIVLAWVIVVLGILVWRRKRHHDTSTE